MTNEDYQKILDALKNVDRSIPIKKYPIEEWSKARVSEVLKFMNERTDNDASLLNDVMWMEQLRQMQEFAGYYGIDV